jgi:hypothetical protein
MPLVGLIVLVASGLGTFTVAGGIRSTIGEAVDCGTHRCIPSLQAADVIGALEAQGYTCGLTPLNSMRASCRSARHAS